jgi:predicted nucleic acid-binding protein
MGVILDSTILVTAERSGVNPRRIFDDLIARMGDAEVALSVITVAELAHGIERVESPVRRRTRDLAGKLDGKLQARGQRVALRLCCGNPQCPVLSSDSRFGC